MSTHSFPLFKGATRLPIVLGVPVVPLFASATVVAVFAMYHLWCWCLLPLVVLVLQQITRHDDRIFRLWGLYLDTTVRNRYRRFWSASSYSAMRYRARSRS